MTNSANGPIIFTYYDESALRIAQSICRYLVRNVNDVIDDKNLVTKIMSKSTGLQHIGLTALPYVIGELVITLLMEFCV